MAPNERNKIPVIPAAQQRSHQGKQGYYAPDRSWNFHPMRFRREKFDMFPPKPVSKTMDMRSVEAKG